jgi:hypothetical protein
LPWRLKIRWRFTKEGIENKAKATFLILARLYKLFFYCGTRPPVASLNSPRFKNNLYKRAAQNNNNKKNTGVISAPGFFNCIF